MGTIIAFFHLRWQVPEAKMFLSRIVRYLIEDGEMFEHGGVDTVDEFLKQ